MTGEVFHSIDKICAVVQKAGSSIMHFYQKPDLKIFIKDDNSPVTEADFVSNKILIQGLTEMFPHIPVVSEENPGKENMQASQKPCFWLVDPLDGTKNFISGKEHFTINLALVKGGVPLLGVLYLPATGICYYGFDNQAFKLEQGRKTIVSGGYDTKILTFITSKRAEKVAVDSIKKILSPNATVITHPSAQKFCFLFEGN